jgi:hypothetical protein
MLNCSIIWENIYIFFYLEASYIILKALLLSLKYINFIAGLSSLGIYNYSKINSLNSKFNRDYYFYNYIKARLYNL